MSQVGRLEHRMSIVTFLSHVQLQETPLRNQVPFSAKIEACEFQVSFQQSPPNTGDLKGSKTYQLLSSVSKPTSQLFSTKKVYMYLYVRQEKLCLKNAFALNLRASEVTFLYSHRIENRIMYTEHVWKKIIYV